MKFKMRNANRMIESTQVDDITTGTVVDQYIDGRSTVDIDDEYEVVEGDTILLAGFTNQVFQAIDAIIEEIDPDADLDVVVNDEDFLSIAVTSDYDLDDEAFEEALQDALIDIDLSDVAVDVTDSHPADDPEELGRVVQYINFTPKVTVVGTSDNPTDTSDDVVSVVSESTDPNKKSDTQIVNELLEAIEPVFEKHGISEDSEIEFGRVDGGLDGGNIEAIYIQVELGEDNMANDELVKDISSAAINAGYDIPDDWCYTETSIEFYYYLSLEDATNESYSAMNESILESNYFRIIIETVSKSLTREFSIMSSGYISDSPEYGIRFPSIKLAEQYAKEVNLVKQIAEPCKIYLANGWNNKFVKLLYDKPGASIGKGIDNKNLINSKYFLVVIQRPLDGPKDNTSSINSATYSISSYGSLEALLHEGIRFPSMELAEQYVKECKITSNDFRKDYYRLGIADSKGNILKMLIEPKSLPKDYYGREMKFPEGNIFRAKSAPPSHLLGITEDDLKESFSRNNESYSVMNEGAAIVDSNYYLVVIQAAKEDKYARGGHKNTSIGDTGDYDIGIGNKNTIRFPSISLAEQYVKEFKLDKCVKSTERLVIIDSNGNIKKLLIKPKESLPSENGIDYEFDEDKDVLDPHNVINNFSGIPGTDDFMHYKGYTEQYLIVIQSPMMNKNNRISDYAFTLRGDTTEIYYVYGGTRFPSIKFAEDYVKAIGYDKKVKDDERLVIINAKGDVRKVLIEPKKVVKDASGDDATYPNTNITRGGGKVADYFKELSTKKQLKWRDDLGHPKYISPLDSKFYVLIQQRPVKNASAVEQSFAAINYLGSNATEMKYAIRFPSSRLAEDYAKEAKLASKIPKTDRLSVFSSDGDLEKVLLEPTEAPEDGYQGFKPYFYEGGIIYKGLLESDGNYSTSDNSYSVMNESRYHDVLKFPTYAEAREYLEDNDIDGEIISPDDNRNKTDDYIILDGHGHPLSESLAPIYPAEATASERTAEDELGINFDNVRCSIHPAFLRKGHIILDRDSRSILEITSDPVANDDPENPSYEVGANLINTLDTSMVQYFNSVADGKVQLSANSDLKLLRKNPLTAE